MVRKDLDRLVEILYLEDMKILKKAKSLTEYYKKATQLLPEFINPEKGYAYNIVRVGEGYLFKVDTVGEDPQFVVTVKKFGKANILDFYWPESEKGFDKRKGLEGTNYLDTLAKIIRDEILPMIESEKLQGGIYFSPYSIDGAGAQRAKVFKRLIDKYVDRSKFTVKELLDNDIFIVKK